MLFSIGSVLLLLGLTAPLDAATVSGRVFSEDYGIYLEGAQVRVSNRDLQVNSGRGGRFIIQNLSPGTYTLEAAYTGFPPIQQELIIENESDRPDILLVFKGQDPAESDLETLSAFTVEGALLGQAKAISQQRAADNLVTVVASDALGQFPDRNAAEALQRLPGISIESDQGEGTFVSIRGAAPSLNSVSVDGVFAATPEEGGRSTSLNIVSIDQLESIEVTKSWLPDQWANFIGGSVNLVTRSALDREEQFASLEAALGHYEIADDRSHRLNLVYGNVFNFGERQRIGFQFSYDNSEDNRGSDTLAVDGYNTDPDTELRGFPKGLQLEGIDLRDFRIQRDREGFSTKIEFELSPGHQWTLSYSYNAFVSDEINQETQLNATGSFAGLFLTRSTAEALGLDPTSPEVAERINDLDKLNFDEHVQLGLFEFDSSSQTFLLSTASTRIDKSWSNAFDDDEINTGQFRGDHRFDGGWKLDYSVHTSKADKIENVKRASFRGPSGETRSGLDGRLPFVSPTRDNYLDPSNYVLNNPNLEGVVQDNRFISGDERTGGTLNLQKEFYSDTFIFTSKLGLALDEREKTFVRDFNRFSEIRTPNNNRESLTLADPLFDGGPLEGEFLPAFGAFTFGPSFNTDGLNGFITDPGDITVEEDNNDLTFNVTDALLRNFESTEDISAAYFMQTVEWKRWKFIGGFRYEETENTFTNNVIDARSDKLPGGIAFANPGTWRFLTPPEDNFLELTETSREYDDLLPAIHVIREVGNNMKVRAAYTETIKRPEFDDLVPREIPSVSGAAFGNSVRLPNFELQPMRSENLDLSFDYYFRNAGYAGINFFFKRFTDAVYTETRRVAPGEPLAAELSQKFIARGTDDTVWNTTRQANSGDGDLYGVEVVLQRRLGFLPQLLSGFSVDLNASFIESEVELLLEERFGEGVSLFKQPDFLANASLIYQRGPVFGRVSLNHRGEFLEQVRGGRFTIRDLEELGLESHALDVWVAELTTVDFILQFSVNDNLSIFFEGRNVFNETREQFFGNEERLRLVQETGSDYFAGFQWKL